MADQFYLIGERPNDNRAKCLIALQPAVMPEERYVIQRLGACEVDAVALLRSVRPTRDEEVATVGGPESIHDRPPFGLG